MIVLLIVIYIYIYTSIVILENHTIVMNITCLTIWTLKQFNYTTLISSVTAKIYCYYFAYLGKNVEEMFTRVAAVIFENVIQSEVKAQQQEKPETIGRGDTLISEW